MTTALPTDRASAPRFAVRWVGYGRPAADALRAAIAEAKGIEPLAPVTVVVPSNHLGVATRRLLASGALGATTVPAAGRQGGIGLVAVSFLTSYRLAELLGASSLAAAGRRPVSTPVLTAAVRAALASDPGMFGPVAEHPATEGALVAAYRELRDLGPSTLDRLAAQGPRAADVVRLHRAARAALEPRWYDEEDLMEAATASLFAGAAIAELGTVIVHLPQRLSRHAAGLLRAVASVSPTRLLVGTTGDADADADVVESLVRLGLPRPDPLAIHSDRPAVGLPVSLGRTRIITTSDADEEVREAIRVVIDAARAGTPLDRVAVLHASPEPYDRLVREHLVAAEVPINGAAGVPVAGRMAGRALLQLLELPLGRFRRQDVFSWLHGAPIRHDGRAIPVVRWEGLSREAGIVGGREQWDRLLASFASRRRAQADDSPDDDARSQSQLDWWRAEADEALRLRSFVLGLADDLEQAAARPQAWSVRVRWARRLFDRMLGGASQRRAWPAAEQKAADRVELALDRLAALDEVEPAVELDAFVRTLTVELETDLGRMGRLGEGVLVGSVAMGIGLDLDLVVVLGLAEGSFPGPIRDDSLLPDAERDAAGGDLPLRKGRVHRQHRELLATLAGAGRHVLLVPRGDLRRSSERVASRWLLDAASELAGQRLWSDDLWRLDAPWVEHVASFDAGLRSMPFPATEQEHRLRAVLAAAVPRGGLGAFAATVDPVMASAFEAIDARRSPAFTRFDGNLAGLAIPSPVDVGSSATSLERWAGCPFAYAMQSLLGVREVDNPEDEVQLTPLDKGSLVHEVLEQFILEVIERGGVAAGQPWSERDLERLHELGEAECDRYEAAGRTGRPLFWRRDRARLLAELGRFAASDDALRARTHARPIATELPFGFAGGPPSVRFPLPGGRSVPLRGRADRIDRADDGTLVVIDYKTGKPYDEKHLTEEEPDLRGRKLQLAVYGQAARDHVGDPGAPVIARYWYVSDRGGFVDHGYEVTPAVLERVSLTMGRIVQGIEDGVFAPHPAEPGPTFGIPCPYCDPDGLGTGELRRQWDRKAADPALVDYVDLAEPRAAEDETEGVTA